MDCLPVAERNELIGIVTNQDMLQVLSSLLESGKPSTDGGEQEFRGQTTEPKMLT